MTKAFERPFRILLQLCRSIFRLIKSQRTAVEKKLFRMQSCIQTKYGGVQASPSTSMKHQRFMETEQMLKNKHI